MLSIRRRLAASVAVAALGVVGLGSASIALASGPSSSPGNSAAHITGSYSDDCTDFTTTSDKDLSHVEFHFADGTTTKNESFHNGDKTYSYSGDKEIDYTLVKSGTTTERFDCEPAPPPAQCSDHQDNDNDGKVDSDDPGCSGPDDNDETDPAPQPQCSDGVDNDNDGKIDFGTGASNDPGCSSADDNDETDAAPQPQCSDGADNDADGKTDYPNDPGCTDANDNDESDGVVVEPDPCAHGGLLAPLTDPDDPTVAWILYDAVLNQVPVFVYPRKNGPISGPVGEALSPVDPVGHEAGCAISLVDGH